MQKKSDLNMYLFMGFICLAVFFLGFKLSAVKTVPVATSDTSASTQPTKKTHAEIASEIGLNVDEFNACMDLPEIAKRVEDEAASGEKAGVRGTPGTYLVDTQANKAIELGGAVPAETLKTTLADLKAGKGTTIAIDPITTADYVKGDTKARYAIIEWSDYECPYCVIFQETASTFVSENKDVKWVYRQYPIEGLHPNTTLNSIAALCAGKIGGNDAFWAFSDKVMGIN